MNRNEIYLTGLLHDIGKFIERTKNQTISEQFKDAKYGHPKYSAQFIYNLRKENNFFSNFTDGMINAILYHHEPKNIDQKILQLADCLSAKEREKDESTEIYFKTPLKSIFSTIFKEDNEITKEFTYPLKELGFDSIFPDTDNDVNQHNYREVVKHFREEICKIEDEEQLYFLLQKYLWSVPAQTWRYNADISLFDHSKTTAAISICLYDQYKDGKLTEKDMRSNSNKEQFVLLNGDLSGIQDFIYNIPTKGASKSLKGRSVYISLISDVTVQYIIDSLSLKNSNILYNGGGNFYILAPQSKESKIQEIIKEINKILLEVHHGDIYYAIDYITLTPADFNDFSIVWDQVKRKVEEKKTKKWSELSLKDNYNIIFGPVDEGTKEKEHCSICGLSSEKIEIISDDEGDISLCEMCKSFINLTNHLKKAGFISIDKIKNNYNMEYKYNSFFNKLGYCVNLKEELTNEDKDKTYVLDSTNFLKNNCRGFKFGAYNLPLEEDGKQITFEGLAKKSFNNDLGDKKIGILKLDVDNLGAIFSKGLEENNRSISRMATLSRMMEMYFQGYINKVIKNYDWEDKIYVVFSGGDDTYIVGAWNAVLEFTKVFYDKFREYTCNNKYITFSASIGVFKYNYPIARSSHLMENNLKGVKNKNNSNDNILPIKNKVSLFGEIFNWYEFERIKKIKDILFDLVVNKEFGHGLLHKVQKSTVGFKAVLNQSKSGIVDNIKMWRLAYYLREVRNDYKDTAEELIDEYKNIVVYNLMEKSKDERINNIMIIPAAVKWAELATRDFKGDD